MNTAKITALANSAKDNSDTSFFRFLPDGGKRAKILVCSLATNFAKTPGTFSFGAIKKGKFVQSGETYVNDISESASPAVKRSSKTPKKPSPPTPAAGGVVLRPAAAKLFDGKRRGSGYVAAIDDLLFDLSTKKEGGYARSKHTVTDAVKILVEKFPEANPGSIRRVVKVRPRHLERSKTSGINGKAPRWALLGQGGGSEYMKKMDALLVEGKLEKKEIASLLSKEFGRDVSKVMATIQARTPKLREKHGKDGVGTKPARALKGEDTKRQATKKKNQALVGGERLEVGTSVDGPSTDGQPGS